MSMTPQTWSLSALAVELNLDRRTLAKRLARVPPAEVRGRAKRWRLREVLRALERPEDRRKARSRDRLDVRDVLDDFTLSVEEMVPWNHTDVVSLPEYEERIGLDGATQQRAGRGAWANAADFVVFV